jgi:hypothetical protein
MVIYTTWVVLPVSRHESECVQIVSRVTETRKKLQARASDLRLNGYLAPDFLPFWGSRKTDPANANVILAGNNPQPDSEIGRLLESIAPLCDLAQGTPTELGKIAKGEVKGTLRPFVDFEAYYPRIHEVENLPLFVVPDSKPQSHSTPTYNFIAVRKLAQGCAGYADYLVFCEKGDQALGVCEDSLKFGSSVRNCSGNLLEMMMAVALQNIAQSSLSMVLQSKVELSLAELHAVSKTLEASQIPQGLLVQSLESDLCLGLNSLEESRSQAIGKGSVGIHWLPGLMAREVRLYKNDYIPLIQQAKNHGAAGIPNLEFAGLSWFLGRRGIFSGLMIPNWARAGEQLTLLRKRQAFLHLYTHLRMEYLSRGVWPASLDELKGRGYHPLEPIELAKVRYSVRQDEIDLELFLDPVELASLPKKPEGGMEKWQILNSPPWMLH